MSKDPNILRVSEQFATNFAQVMAALPVIKTVDIKPVVEGPFDGSYTEITVQRIGDGPAFSFTTVTNLGHLALISHLRYGIDKTPNSGAFLHGALTTPQEQTVAIADAVSHLLGSLTLGR